MCALTEYCVLALLLWRAFRRPRKTIRVPGTGVKPARVADGRAYAATDEFHQIFVPTRTPAVHDVVIDTLGGAAGLFCFG